MVEYTKEQIEESTQGFYRTGAFHIFLKGKFDQDISKLSVEDQGTFLHEYVHFLQNISTPWGIFVGATRNSEIVEDFQSISQEEDIPIPYKKTIHSEQLLSRLNWIKAMDGFSSFPKNLEWDVDKVLKLGIADMKLSGRDGKCMIIIAKMKDGREQTIAVGAHIIKESMAAMYQSLIDPSSSPKHKDVPYNLIHFICKDFFPSISNDIKKLICLCYTSLFSQSPSYELYNLLNYAEDKKELSGFEIFNEYVSNNRVNVNNHSISIPDHFDMLIDTYKQSIQGLIRGKLKYIDILLDRVRLHNGNVPILNVINDNEPFSSDNIQSLVNWLGIPYIHAASKGWYFPTTEEEHGGSDVIKLLGDTWLFEYLVYPKNKLGICPLASICGGQKDFCYEKPWVETNCTFGEICDDLNLHQKNVYLNFC